MKKKGNNTENVYELIQKRLKFIFDEFDNIYVSFSGGKDSGVLLNLCIDYIRKHNLNRKIGVFHMDYEAQYKMTTDYVEETFRQNLDILEIYHVCVPFKVVTCASMYQQFWRPWDEEMHANWVRPMPKNCYKKEDFPFYNDEMWDYNFQVEFGRWYHKKKDAVRTACLVGIRTQESLDRWRTIYSNNRLFTYHNLKWSRRIGYDLFNLYPIYDWRTEDIWVAYARFKWPFNQLYELYYKAGVPLDKQRVASPFLSTAQETLKLYKAIDPNTWGRMLGRVNGVNFTGIYGGTRAMGWQRIGYDLFNLYPIYDWRTEDIWVAYARFKWPFNQLYELYYKAGVPLDKQRVASPFLSTAQETLKLYKAIDPNTWGRMLGRVNGVNFTGIYGGTRAMGWQSIKLPKGYTWREYMYFLLETLPEDMKNAYLEKLRVSREFWKYRGGCLSLETIRKLNELGINMHVQKTTNYKTDKLPVQMDYLDDIDIPEFKEIPTYKRMCICILKNDHVCKYMGFALTKKEKQRRDKVMQKYKNIMR